MKTLISSILFLASFNTFATEWINVPDASKLKWQLTSSGTVFFRNLNEFDSEQDGCCYSYKLDTTTPGGKSTWSTILAKMAGKQPITIGFPQVGSPSNVQSVSAIGIH